MPAKPGDTVKVHYTGTLEDGTVFDSSAQREPLEFTIGEGRIIPGFEQAVVGMSPGETKVHTIAAHQAYGPRRQDMMFQIDRDEVPTGLHLSVGQRLQIEDPDGGVTRVLVSGLSGDKVTLDANHPLAGKDLTFEIELLSIE